MFAAPARLVPLFVVFVVAACASASACSISPHISNPEVSLAGQVVVESQTGHIVLRLGGHVCRQSEDRLDKNGGATTTELPCQLHWSSVRLVAPWGQTFTPTEGGEDHVAFTVDWAGAGIDVLDSDHPELLTRAWRFSSPEAPRTLEWVPDRATQRTMLALIGVATATETEVVDEGPPPRVVAEAHFAAELRNDDGNQLLVSLTNQGEGAAYRLRVTTSSNIPELHGLHLSFGRLRPGETKIRRARVELARDNPEGEAVVVLTFEEAHGFGPAQASVRAKVQPATDQAVLALACRFDGLQGEPPRVDAGATVHLACDVRNDGSAAHGVRMHVSYPGRKTPIDLPPFDLGGKQSQRVNIALGVPREAAIDSELPVEVSVVDDLGVRAEITVQLAIARPKLCPDGRITRERFLEKRAALRKKRDAGLISDEDYKRYEEELIGCMEP